MAAFFVITCVRRLFSRMQDSIETLCRLFDPSKLQLCLCDMNHDQWNCSVLNFYSIMKSTDLRPWFLLQFWTKFTWSWYRGCSQPLSEILGVRSGYLFNMLASQGQVLVRLVPRQPCMSISISMSIFMQSISGMEHSTWWHPTKK